MTDDRESTRGQATMADGDRLIGAEIGNFRIERVLGEGGMGTVFVASHHTLARKVAVKVLSSALAEDRGLVSRFVDEARAVSEIGHPGLIQIFDFGRLPSGQLYSIMEYLEGRDLERAIREDGPMAPERAARIGAQVAAAAAAAHERGIIHRDLKPANIFLARGGEGEERVVLLDFGIAKLLDRDSDGPSRTRQGQVIGTPEYLAPEQARGDPSVDARVDVYSLGCVLYEATTGAPPFRSESVPALLIAHVQETPPPLREFGPDVPPELELAVMRCLEKEPDARFPSMTELRDRLRALAGKRASPAGSSGAGAADPEIATGPTEHGARRTPEPIRSGARQSDGGSPSADEPFPTLPGADGGVAASSDPAHASPAAPISGGQTMPEAPGPRRRAWLRGLAAVIGVAAAAGVGLAVLSEGEGEGEDRNGAGASADFEPWESAEILDENPYSPEHGAAIGAGAAIWQRSCAGCHGEEGEGDGDEAPAGLEPQVFADQHTHRGAIDRYRFEIIRHGIEGEGGDYAMPAFEGELTPEEVWQVVTFVATLEAEAAEAPASGEMEEIPDLDDEARVAAGAELFAQRCSSCHGPDGAGGGEASRFLSRAPADLTAGVFKLRSTPSGALPRDEDLFRTITRGMGPVGMPSFAGLPQEDRWALVAYVRALSDRFDDEEAPPPIEIPERPPMDEESIATGRELFELSGCDTCHGDGGRGDGPEAPGLEDHRGRPIAPPDFASPDVFIGGSAPDDIYRTMMTGIDGTPMRPGTDFFTADQAWDVVHFILAAGDGGP